METLDTSAVENTGVFLNWNSSQNYTAESSESEMQIIIYVYLMPILIFSGIISNGCTLYFVRTKQLRIHSVSTHIAAYTVSNILSLIFNSSIDWWMNIYETRHFIHFSDPVCRLWQFCIRLVTYSGAWFVVAMVTDRFIVVWYPAKAKHFCSVFVSKVTVVSIMIGMTVISVHALWSYSVVQNWCYLPGIVDDANIAIWQLISGFCYSFIPILVIFIVGNMTAAAMCFTDTSRPRPTPEQMTNKDLTCSTVIIAFLYFVFNTPATIINIIDRLAPVSWREIPHVVQTMEVVRDISLLLAWINYSLIFFVCLISWNLFREILKKNIHALRLSKSESAEIVNV